MNDVLQITPCRRFMGTVSIYGSKSIANRAIILAGLSGKRVHIDNLPNNLISDSDISVALEAIQKLGVSIKLKKSSVGQTAMIHSQKKISSPSSMLVHKHPQRLQLQNAGTVFRMLTAIVSAGNGFFF